MGVCFAQSAAAVNNCETNQYLEVFIMAKNYVEDLTEEYSKMEPALQEQMAILLNNQLKACGGDDVPIEKLSESYFSSGLANTGYNAPFSNSTAPKFAELEAQFPFMALNLMRTAGPQLFTHQLCATQAIDRPDGSAYVMKFKYAERGVDAKNWKEANFHNVPEFAGSTGRQNSPTGVRNFMVSGEVANGVNGTWYDLSGKLRETKDPNASGYGAGRTYAEAWSFNPEDDEFTFPELSISVSRQSVNAISRKNGATFSTEFLEDAAANGLNIIPIMMRALKKNLILATERETLARVRTLAFRNGSPTAIDRPDLVGEYGSSDYFTYYFNCAKAGGLWQQQKFGAVANIIVSAANDLLMRNHAGAGNIAVVSPMIASILQCSGSQFRGIDVKVNVGGTGVPEIGTLNGGTIRVFVDSQARDNVAVVAYKGTDLADAGLIYCPYKINLEYEAVDSGNFGKRIGVANRYAWCINRLGADLYYSTIYFDGVKELLRDGDSPILIQQAGPKPSAPAPDND